MIKTILLLLTLMVSIQVWAQFSIIPSGTTSDINTIEHRDGQIFFLGHNYLSKTKDYGASLIQLNAPTQLPYTYALNVLDTSNLYLISAVHNPDYIYRIMHSSDGGNSWKVIFDTTGAPIHDLAVSKAGHMVGVGNFGDVFKSADGTNWTTSNAGNISTIFKCESLSDSLFLIGGFQYTGRSADTGNTWTNAYFNQSYCSKILPVNPDTIYMSSYFSNGWESYFSRSVDGGNTWTTHSMGKGVGVFGMDFTSAVHGYAVGYDYDLSVGVVFETFNSGNTWVKHLTSFNSVFLDVAILNDSIIFIAGSNGMLLRTANLRLGVNSHVQEELFSVNVFPNPAHSCATITIAASKPGTYKALLTGATGKNIKELAFNATTTVNDIASGIYFIRVSDAHHNTITKKVIIE